MLNTPIFEGFSEPEENWYRLPNNWFDIWHLVRQEYGPRFAALLKMLEYILIHTWGAGRFNGSVQLSANEIRSGRRTQKDKRLDQGTGLSENAVRKAGDFLCRFGLLEIEQDNKDQARRLRSYHPHMKIQHDEPNSDESFSGFTSPTQSYFKVPKIWISIASSIKSAATILVIEYLIRHAWGYHNPEGVWLTTDEIAHGRQYKDGHRYDNGTGFDVSTIHRALKEAVSLGLVVWEEKFEAGISFRRFNLLLKGMSVNAQGQHLEDASGANEVVSDLIDNSSISFDEDVKSTKEDTACAKEVVNDANKARSGEGHTLKNTHQRHSFKTPSSMQQFRKPKSQKSKSARDDDVLPLPGKLLDMLREMGWNDSIGSIQKHYASDPKRVMAWAKCALEKPGLTRRAGYFRKRLDSGESAPKAKIEKSQSEDRNRYVSGKYADFLD